MLDLTPLFVLFATEPVYFYISVFVFSLLIGSFLNVVIYRLPIMLKRDWTEQSLAYFAEDLPPAFIQKHRIVGRFDLIKPDSTCPHCQHNIRAWQNIPVISYVWLRGACAHCRHKISLRYPLVELATACIGVWTAVHFGVTLQTLVLLFSSYLLISMIMIDFDHLLLPDDLTLGLLWLGLLAGLGNLFVTLPDAVIGAALGYTILWLIYWGFKLITGKEGMGYGDFKLLAALGAFVGWQHLLIIILLSSVVGLILGLLIPRLQSQQPDVPQQTIPFGPFLGIAGWLTIFYGDVIQSAYLQWALH